MVKKQGGNFLPTFVCAYCARRKGRAPSVDRRHSGLPSIRLLRPGTPTSPKGHRLWLLPSGPDQVHGSLPRGTRPSSPRDRGSPTMPGLGRGFSPAQADCGYRAPLAPHLARPSLSLANHSNSSNHGLYGTRASPPSTRITLPVIQPSPGWLSA